MGAPSASRSGVPSRTKPPDRRLRARALFLPDWVGEFVFTVDEEDPEAILEAGMVTNYESMVHYAMIDTIVYEENGARALKPSARPRGRRLRSTAAIATSTRAPNPSRACLSVKERGRWKDELRHR
jgi:hypothetical protein